MRTSFLGSLQVIFTGILGLYIDSVFEQKLLFLEKFFKPEISQKILDNYIIIIVIFGLINLIIYYISHKDGINKAQKVIYDNICYKIFENFIKSNTRLNHSNFRVSLFKADKKLIFKRDFYYLPQYRTILENKARHQTKQEKKLCGVKFLPGEGAVGVCFQIGTLIFFETSTYNVNNPQKYYREQMAKTSIPEFKLKKTNTKSSYLICCPIKFFGSDDLFGVIVVDSTVKQNIIKEEFRKIEEVLDYYSVFFIKK